MRSTRITSFVVLFFLAMMPGALAAYTQEFAHKVDGSAVMGISHSAQNDNGTGMLFDLPAGRGFNLTLANASLKVGGGAPTDKLVMAIWNYSGGTPDSIITNSSNLVDVSGWAGVDNATFTFSPAVELSGGVSYILDIHTYDETSDAVNYMQWRSGFPKTSELWRKQGNAWAGAPFDATWNGTMWLYSGGVTAPTGNFTITAIQYYNGTAINDFNATVNGTDYTTSTGTIITNILNVSGDAFDVNISVPNHFNRTYYDWNTSEDLEANVTPYTAVRAINGYDNSTIQTFNVSWFNSTDTGLYQASDYWAWIPIYNGTFNLTGVNPDYVNGSRLITGANVTQFENLTLYPHPSVVEIYVYDADNGSILGEDINLTVTGNSSEESYVISGGYKYVGNLSADVYTLKFIGANYSLSIYQLTVGTNTHQELSVYLQRNTQAVVFTIRDEDSGALLEDAYIQQQRIINSSWATIMSIYSDITGSAQLQYRENIKYRFIITLADYENKQFELDPVLFSSYNILMTSSEAVAEDMPYTGVTINIDPENFEGNATQNITLTFISPGGILESYGFAAFFPGTNSPVINSSTNAIGSSVMGTMNISTSSLFDTLNLTFWYDTTTGDNHSFTYLYLLTGEAANNTIAAISDTDYGFSGFEKILYGTIGTAVIGGAGFLFGGPLIGGALALFGMGWFYYIGFFTLWLTLPSILLGVILIIWGASR